MKLNPHFHALSPCCAFLHVVLAPWSGLLTWPSPASPCGPLGEAPFTTELSHLTLLLPWRVTNHLGLHGTKGFPGVQNFSAQTRKSPNPSLRALVFLVSTHFYFKCYCEWHTALHLPLFTSFPLECKLRGHGKDLFIFVALSSIPSGQQHVRISWKAHCCCFSFFKHLPTPRDSDLIDPGWGLGMGCILKLNQVILMCSQGC